MYLITALTLNIFLEIHDFSLNFDILATHRPQNRVTIDCTPK